LVPGPGEVGQGDLKVLHLRQGSQNTRTPNQFFFEWRLAASFE